MPVHIADDPLTSVVRGAGLVLEDIDFLKEVLMTTQYEKSPRV
jgi:actin-like ATPase involved in cell morphogenesis